MALFLKKIEPFKSIWAIVLRYQPGSPAWGRPQATELGPYEIPIQGSIEAHGPGALKQKNAVRTLWIPTAFFVAFTNQLKNEFPREL